MVLPFVDSQLHLLERRRVTKFIYQPKSVVMQTMENAYNKLMLAATFLKRYFYVALELAF